MRVQEIRQSRFARFQQCGCRRSSSLRARRGRARCRFYALAAARLRLRRARTRPVLIPAALPEEQAAGPSPASAQRLRTEPTAPAVDRSSSAPPRSRRAACCPTKPNTQPRRRQPEAVPIAAGNWYARPGCHGNGLTGTSREGTSVRRRGRRPPRHQRVHVTSPCRRPPVRRNSSDAGRGQPRQRFGISSRSASMSYAGSPRSVAPSRSSPGEGSQVGATAARSIVFRQFAAQRGLGSAVVPSSRDPPGRKAVACSLMHPVASHRRAARIRLALRLGA